MIKIVLAVIEFENYLDLINQCKISLTLIFLNQLKITLKNFKIYLKNENKN